MATDRTTLKDMLVRRSVACQGYVCLSQSLWTTVRTATVCSARSLPVLYSQSLCSSL